MLSRYQLKIIADLYNIPIGNVKKLVPNVFDKEKYVIHYKKLQLYLTCAATSLKNALHNSVNDKDGKVLYKLMKNAVYGKLMKNLRNRLDVKVISNKKSYLQQIYKPRYMSQKLIDNNLVTICKNKVTLTLDKPGYIGMCILELSNVLMYEFHYGYIKNKYGYKSRLF